MPYTPIFDFRDWLVPPVLMPIFFGLLIAATAVHQRYSPVRSATAKFARVADGT
jgi:hypothetical protein